MLDENLLRQSGFAQEDIDKIHAQAESLTPEALWQWLSTEVLKSEHPDALHQMFYHYCYRDRDIYLEPGAMWFPDQHAKKRSNIASALTELELDSYDSFYQWSIDAQDDFLAWTVEQLGIQFEVPFSAIRDPKSPIEAMKWFAGGTLNIVDSCLQGPLDAPAIRYWHMPTQAIKTWSYKTLRKKTEEIAAALIAAEIGPEASVGLAMGMGPDAIAAYLAIIKVGAVAVPVAESFSAEEMQVRFYIANVQLVLSQDFLPWQNKQIALYEKVCKATDAAIIVFSPETKKTTLTLREHDQTWVSFIESGSGHSAPTTHHKPAHAITLLFSSGTTGAPKAIPWDHSTAIKCALDGYYHQDVQPGDVFAWPTSLGWMMGPWLIFATLINKGCVALFQDAPTHLQFPDFVEQAGVTQLGLVPSIVKYWRTHKSLRDEAAQTCVNWRALKLFSSSGECSNVDDMLFLSSIAGYKPIIEYCGGTEIGGGYITSSVLQSNAPTVFSTATLGTAFELIHQEKHANKVVSGEVALIPPTLGLSRTLLNRDHYETYFAAMPRTNNGIVLRRHGDQIQKLGAGRFRLLGRSDDTMNLGGIKVSSADIERILIEHECIEACAAIASAPKEGGPSRLIIFIETVDEEQISSDTQKTLQNSLQQQIAKHLNPLFKIHALVYIDKIPRTASNKIMRRVLRDRYLDEHPNA